MSSENQGNFNVVIWVFHQGNSTLTAPNSNEYTAGFVTNEGGNFI